MSKVMLNGVSFNEGSTTFKIYKRHCDGLSIGLIAEQLHLSHRKVWEVLRWVDNKRSLLHLGDNIILEPSSTSHSEPIITQNPTITPLENPDLEYLKEFKVDFCINYNKVDNDLIFVNIKVTDDLKNLLKQVIVETMDLQDYIYKNNRFKRFRVKSWIYNELQYSEKDILFDKLLLEQGQKELSFIKMSELEQCVEQMKIVLEKFVHTYYKYRNFKPTIEIKVKEKQKQELRYEND